MKGEDQMLEPMEAEMGSLSQGTAHHNRPKEGAAQENTQLFGSFNAYLRLISWSMELLYDQQSAAAKQQKPLVEQAGQDSSSSLIIDRGDNVDRSLNLNMLQPSETYQNGLALSSEMHVKSQASEGHLHYEDPEHNIIQSHKVPRQQQIQTTPTRSILTRSQTHKFKKEVETICQAKEQCKIEQQSMQARPVFIKSRYCKESASALNCPKQIDAMPAKKAKKGTNRKVKAEKRGNKFQRQIYTRRKAGFPLMEQKLIQWINMGCERGSRITQRLIRRKALSLLKGFDQYKQSNFTASNGWIQKFLHRHPRTCELLSSNRILESDENNQDEGK